MAADVENSLKTRKVFFAVDVPQSVREALHTVAKEFEAYNVPILTVDKYHITLEHVGGIKEQQMCHVAEALSGVRSGKFAATVSGLSYFGQDSIQIVFAKVITEGNGLNSLREDILRGLRRDNITLTNENPFSQHVTIALPRGNFDDELLKRIIEANKNTKFGSFEVDSVALKESVRSTSGQSHKVLRKVTL